MSKGVVFVGMYRQDWIKKDFSELKALGDVWSCQDWYAKFNNKEIWYPDVVFQIHEKANDPDAYNIDHRFPGDWKAEYNKCEEVISSVPLDGIIKNTVIPMKEFRKDMGAGYFASTISYMFHMAIKRYYDKITLIGCKFARDGEHENQIFGMWKNVEDARSRGIEVINPYEDYWLANMCGPMRDANDVPVQYGVEAPSDLTIKVGKHDKS